MPGLWKQGAGTSVNVFSPPVFWCLELLHTPAGWTATCPPRIPFQPSSNSLPQFFHRRDLGSPHPPTSAPRSTFNASVPLSVFLKLTLFRSLSIRLANSLLPSVFNMWRSGISLPSYWLPIRTFPTESAREKKKIYFFAASVMQFSSSQGFFFYGCNFIRFRPRQTIRLRAGVECVLRGDSKRPCNSSVHSCRRTCQSDTSKPPSGLSANVFPLRATSVIIVNLSLVLPKVQMLHHLASKSPPPSPLLSSPRASAASH